MMIVLLALLAGFCTADVPADEVSQIPGFNKTSFKVYSGYLKVPGPFKENEYDSLSIHYQFHHSQNNPDKDPIATWHQGGPGGSSIYGQYGEMGYFQVDDRGYNANPFAWNKVANMLYLESPAGSHNPIGFSSCLKSGKIQDRCTWNDTSQAEAYAHTLKAFFTSFPEFKTHDLYLTGESYAGQYVPNIANFILNNKGFADNLKGVALGNACWGGDATHVQCNGPNSQQNDVDMYYGKGLVSAELYNQIYKACFPSRSSECSGLLSKMHSAVGPHNVYNIYDNCPNTERFLKRTGKTMDWLLTYLRNQMNTNNENEQVLEKELGAGYDWGCDQMNEMAEFFKKPDVVKAMHLSSAQSSGFSYHSSGPASITLWPSLVKKLRVLIYNGDADACVPYKGNEEWTTGLAKQGVLVPKAAWHPWYVTGAAAHIPAGYATTYTPKDTELDFSFVTIRLAGHMVPAFQPAPALEFFTRFLAGTPF